METGQQQQPFLAGCLVMLCAGMALAKFCGWQAGSWGMAALLAAAGASGILIWRSSRWSWLALLLAAFLLGWVRFDAARTLPENDIVHLAGQEVKVTGTLREEPRVTEDLTGQRKVRYALDVSKARLAGDEQIRSGGLYVYARVAEGEVPAAQVGDRLTAVGKIKAPHGYRNPGQLDTRGLLRAQGITASLAAGKRGVTIEPQAGYAFARWITGVREHYRAAMSAVMPREDAAAIFALLFGGYEGIRPELLEDFTTAGIVHILSVSGSHISLLAAVMAWLGTLFRLPRQATAVLVIGVIIIYSILAGCVPPVIRSAIMGGLAFLALSLEREKAAGRILVLTGLVMLVVSPLLLFHISFQLSFLATAGLLYLAPAIRGWLLQRGWPEFLAGSFAITIAAQAAALPILAWYFNQLSLAALLANLLVVPILEWMIVAALLAGLVAFFLPLAGKLVFAGDSLLLGAVAELTRGIAHLPASQVWVPSLGAFWSGLYYSGLVFCLLPLELRQRWQAALLRQKQLLAVLLAAVCLLAGWWYMQPAEMTVHFIDVGQGDACLVITPGHHAFMIDTGGTRDGAFDVGARVDIPYLWHYGVRKLDYIFLTHAHEDHAAGAGAIVRKLPVGKVVTASEGAAAYRRSLQLPAVPPVTLAEAEEGASFCIDGVKLEVIFAPKQLDAKGRAGNEASNVYRVSYGKASFLFTGDLVTENETKLLAQGKKVRSTVLKVGHHGSDTSTSEAFLQAVAPKWGVFCVGADNSFGHPRPEVVKRLETAGVTIYRTDKDGAVVFHTDGEKMRVEAYGAGEFAE